MAVVGALSVLGLAGASSTPTTVPVASPSAGQKTALPVLAYYYMWFTPGSWSHGKTDVPALGAYTSTNQAIIHQQVAWAKESGVDAFVVSWKSTPSLNLALSELVAECHSQGLKLVLIYEGLDNNRNPIATSTVSADLNWFMAHYGSDPVFNVFGRPAIIWSGTWRFSNSDISAIRAQLGAPGNVLLLGSEKSAADYQARASLFDGDAYYWSSADPLSTPGYQKRLNDLSAAVHADSALWLAPAAAGYDGRLNGGTTVVDRRNGATLTAAWADALASKPDALALISWNEYTENSYVEPSLNFGTRYLTVLSLLTGAAGPGATPSLPADTPSASPKATATPAPTDTPPGGLAVATGGSTSGRPSTPYNWTPSLLVAGLVLLVIALLGYNFRARARRKMLEDGPATGPEQTSRPGSLGRPAR
jgi:hypothetical protein